MSVRYDPLLAAALARELEARYEAEPVAALGLNGDAWTAALAFADGSALWFFLHPRAGQIVPGDRSPLCSLLADRARWKKARRQGVLRADGWVWWTFRGLGVSGVESPPDERLIYLTLSDAITDRFRVVLDLPRNRRNALLLERTPSDGDPAETRMGASETGWRIRAMLRARPGGIAAGYAYRPPIGVRQGADALLPITEWLQLVETRDASTEALTLGAASALRQVAFTSALNLDYILGQSRIDALPNAAARCGAARPDEDQQAAYERYKEVLGSHGPWMLRRTWGLQPYVHPLGMEDAKPIDSLLDGMARAAAEEAVEPPASENAATLRSASDVASALRRKRKRLRRRLAALQKEMEEGGEAEKLRATGHLLLAHLREVPKGAASVELPDFDGSSRRIELDPALDAAANANRYYRSAARRERARDRLPSMIVDVRRDIESIEAGLERLADTAGTEEPDDALRELAEMPAASKERLGAAAAPERLPYHRFLSTGGLEIRVGRSSKDNDALTFGHSAPDDIWLHARQVPGAHVVLRWNRRDQNPSERDLADAAVLAALHSDARHSGVVAVDWTRRKYVRKPRKAGSGLVLADRSKTVFVEPDPAAVRRLRPKA